MNPDPDDGPDWVVWSTLVAFIVLTVGLVVTLVLLAGS